MRLPSRRQYPDYYEQIKRPIALDDIKRRLEGGSYAFFDEVRGDFEQCFKNAKKYNMKESQIWKDAKHLHVRTCLHPLLNCLGVGPTLVMHTI
jgi:chromatin structure-remodeling complex subunit RSC4